MPKDEDNLDDKDSILPAQIPLLDEVIYDTELPFTKPKVKARARVSVPEEDIPRATDLFGGSPETAQTGPLSSNYEAEDLDEVNRTVRDRTDRVVDNLVAEYSQEIVERLRDELTAVLDDLKQDSPDGPR